MYTDCLLSCPADKTNNGTSNRGSFQFGWDHTRFRLQATNIEFEFWGQRDCCCLDHAYSLQNTKFHKNEKFYVKKLSFETWSHSWFVLRIRLESVLYLMSICSFIGWLLRFYLSLYCSDGGLIISICWDSLHNESFWLACNLLAEVAWYWLSCLLIRSCYANEINIYFQLAHPNSINSKFLLADF